VNIFVLDEDPIKAAEMHCDKHCVKMILEYAQLMSTAHRVLDGDDAPEQCYKIAHKNHPSTIWTRQSKGNYQWLYSLWSALCVEYTRRYGKVHLTWKKLGITLANIPKNIPINKMTEIPQAMPDYCKKENVVEGYRNYYLNEKKDFAKWKTEVPYWWTA